MADFKKDTLKTQNTQRYWDSQTNYQKTRAFLGKFVEFLNLNYVSFGPIPLLKPPFGVTSTEARYNLPRNLHSEKTNFSNGNSSFIREKWKSFSENLEDHPVLFMAMLDLVGGFNPFEKTWYSQNLFPILLK